MCDVEAIPVAKVTWTKNGGPILAKHSVNGTNLVLSEQSGTSDSGSYACTARNPLGKDSAFSDITFIGKQANYVCLKELRCGLRMFKSAAEILKLVVRNPS